MINYSTSSDNSIPPKSNHYLYQRSVCTLTSWRNEACTRSIRVWRDLILCSIHSRIRRWDFHARFVHRTLTVYLCARPSEPIHFVALIRIFIVSMITCLTASLFLDVWDVCKSDFTLNTFAREEDRTTKQARLYFDHRKSNQEMDPFLHICSASILNAYNKPLTTVLMYLFELIFGTIPDEMYRQFHPP